MYRNDYNAVYERAQALERDLKEAQSSREHDAAQIEFLQRELQKAHQWLYAAQAQGSLPGQQQPLPRSNAQTALVLGVLSLAVCGILGPFAWSSGNSEIQKMDEGLVDPSERGSAVAGKVCGIIATCFLGLAVLFGVLLVATAAAF